MQIKGAVLQGLVSSYWSAHTGEENEEGTITI